MALVAGTNYKDKTLFLLPTYEKRKGYQLKTRQIVS